jgi:hypothetical protein
MQAIALCVPYEVVEAAGGRRWRVAPGAIDLSPAALHNVDVTDEDGHVLGCFRDGSAELVEVNGRNWRGVELRLNNLDPSDAGDRKAIRMMEVNPSGFRVDYDDTLHEELRAGVTTYTQLRIRGIVLTCEQPDPGTGRIIFLKVPRVA